MKLNRVIDPSLIEIGDTISVVHPRNQGIVHILEGVVHKRQETGNVRYFTTSEGATLLAWTPGVRTNVKVTLLSRPEVTPPQITFINEFLDETRERIA
jgi:hypothetical protein